LNSLNLNQDDQVREELTKTVIHDNHFIHVLTRLGVCARALLLCRRISPCLRPPLEDVRNFDTPIREQQAAVTVRYMRADQQAAVAVEPLRLTCASSGADSAAAATAATAAVAVSSASFVASTSLSAARAAASISFFVRVMIDGFYSQNGRVNP
jgi:hypothetical protein